MSYSMSCIDTHTWKQGDRKKIFVVHRTKGKVQKYRRQDTCIHCPCVRIITRELWGNSASTTYRLDGMTTGLPPVCGFKRPPRKSFQIHTWILGEWEGATWIGQGKDKVITGERRMSACACGATREERRRLPIVKKRGSQHALHYKEGRNYGSLCPPCKESELCI